MSGRKRPNPSFWKNAGNPSFIWNEFFESLNGELCISVAGIRRYCNKDQTEKCKLGITDDFMCHPQPRELSDTEKNVVEGQEKFFSGNYSALTVYPAVRQTIIQSDKAEICFRMSGPSVPGKCWHMPYYGDVKTRCRSSRPNLNAFLEDASNTGANVCNSMLMALSYVNCKETKYY